MGMLRSQTFFCGRMALDGAAARAAYNTLGRKLVESSEYVAAKVYAIANTKMAHAVRLVSVRDGHDPREYALVAFGGAGPLHACAIADELGMRRVIVPRFPGAFSAFGLLCADLKRDFVQSLLLPMQNLDDNTLKTHLQAFLDSLRVEVADIFGGRRVHWKCWADTRYVGQASEISVPIRSPRSASLNRVINEFHRMHKQLFGFANPDSDVELINLRLQASVHRQSPSFPEWHLNGGTEPKGEDGTIVFGQPIACRFFSRDSLPVGFHLVGAAIIEESTATTFVPPEWSMTIERHGHLDLQRE